MIAEQARDKHQGALGHDVRRLIAQAEKGTPFDFEDEGLAYDVAEAMRAALQARLGTHNWLADEMLRRLEAFAHKSGTAYAYVRMVISDILPDLKEYNPCELIVFDGISESGSDFSSVVQRATIHGTQMTSINVTDLREYFERGRKRQLLVMLGSDRKQDIQRLEALLQNLGAIVDIPGISAQAVQEIIAAIRTGKATPAITKLADAIVKLAQLHSIPVNVSTLSAIQDLTRDISRLIITLRTDKSVNPALLRSVRTVVVAIKGSVRAEMRMPSAKNDNIPLSFAHKSSRISIGVVQKAGGLTKNTPLIPAQRRELAVLLRASRSDRIQHLNLKDVSPAVLHIFGQFLVRKLASPAPRVTMQKQAGLVMAQILKSAVPQLVLPHIRLMLMPAIASPFLQPQIRQAVQTSIMRNAMPPVADLFVQHPQIISVLPSGHVAQKLQDILRLTRPAPEQKVQIVSALNTALEKSLPVALPVKKNEQVAERVSPASLTRTHVAKQEVTTPAASQKQAASGLQYEADGVTLKPCCRDKFGPVAGRVENQDSGDIVVRNTHGQAIAHFSAQAVSQSVIDQQEITQRLRAESTDKPTPEAQNEWANETMRKLQALEKREKVPENEGTQNAHKSDTGHMHDAFCGCAAGENEPSGSSGGNEIVKEANVVFVTVATVEAEKPRRGRTRTIWPA